MLVQSDRFTYQPFDMPRPSSTKLKHGTRHAVSLLNLILNQAGFRSGRSILPHFLPFQLILVNLTNQSRVFGRSLPLSTSPSLPIYLASCFFPQAYFGCFLALLDGLNAMFLTGALSWFFKITQLVSLESIKLFVKDLFWLVLVALFITNLTALLPSSFNCSLYADLVI